MIVLGDFAENFKCVIQDEIQGFYWNKQSCTLHPIVICYKKDNILTQKSICFISDDLNNETCFVYEGMKQTVNIIKEEIFTEPIMMHYFSDGCAGQYKNCKNFINLCLHERDFSIKCVWSFFATSHGKSPCDGLEGTLFQHKIWFLSGACWMQGSRKCVPCPAQGAFINLFPSLRA